MPLYVYIYMCNVSKAPSIPSSGLAWAHGPVRRGDVCTMGDTRGYWPHQPVSTHPNRPPTQHAESSFLPHQPSAGTSGESTGAAPNSTHVYTRQSEQSEQLSPYRMDLGSKGGLDWKVKDLFGWIIGTASKKYEIN